MLNDKIALITGGGRGIGAAIAKEMAENGATVIINYGHSADSAEKLAASIIENGGKAETYSCDISDYSAVKQMIGDILAKHKRIDILVNNAGIVKDNLIMRMSELEFDQVIDINLKGAFNCIQNVTRPMMKQRGGRIINISSIVGLHGNAGQLNYSASKAGLIGMTKSAAKELGSRGITVNAIAPGFIQTEMTAGLDEKIKEQMMSGIPLGYFGEGKDIAEAACFLASDAARYITGQVLGIDGGMGC